MRKNKIILSIAALAGLLAGLTHAPANAFLVTVTGTSVDFSYDDSLLGLYGAPTISGDRLFFSPTQFRSGSLNGAGMSSTPTTTFIDIHAHDGYSFSSLALTEIGAYKLLGRNSFVDSGGEILVIDKNNPPATAPHANAFFDWPGNPNIRDGALHSWTTSTQVDLAGSNWTGTTMIRVTLANMLDAYTATDTCSPQSVTPQSLKKPSRRKHAAQRGKVLASTATSGNGCDAQQAFIDMRYSGLHLSMATAAPTAVPVPAALALFFPGLLALLAVGTRHRAR